MKIKTKSSRSIRPQHASKLPKVIMTLPRAVAIGNMTIMKATQIVIKAIP